MPKTVKTPTKAASNAQSWLEILDKLIFWRWENVAPVDTMGCTMMADTKDPKLFRYQTLVSLQLSSQTKDQINAAAMEKLKQIPGGLTPQTIVDIPETQLNNLISAVGFHNRKTIYLKKTAEILLREYDGDIPHTIEDLLKLPGVGPKMGYLALQCAWNINDGIGVDVHVHRISNRIGWVSSKTPEETRFQLENWLPREHWPVINTTLVGFGQLHCTAIKPKCADCPIQKECKKIGLKPSPIKQQR